MINGGKQLEHNPSKHIGRHWRHFYAHYKAGTLTHEYKRVIGDSNYSILKANNHITYDDTIERAVRLKVCSAHNFGVYAPMRTVAAMCSITTILYPLIRKSCKRGFIEACFNTIRKDSCSSEASSNMLRHKKTAHIISRAIYIFATQPLP
jgi:hypothetical protein